METIAHRDMRNHSSEILARVAAGESIAVTNHGRLAAIISPPAARPLDRARQAGAVRERRPHAVKLSKLPRARLQESSAEVLTDLRGER